MSGTLRTSAPRGTATARRHRKTLVAIESALAVSGLGGGLMLVSGQGTPPVEWISALGLTTWRLPGLWLTATVAVPSAVAAYLAWRGSSRTPRAVLVASVLLGVELLVQIPFLGPSWLQAVMAVVGGTAAALAVHGRRTW